MREALLWTLVIVATCVVLLVVLRRLLRWRLERRNRVSPAVGSPAPVWWLWSRRRTARMHRRLQRAVADIHLAPSRRAPHRDAPSVDDLRRELEYQAVELDHHLVIVNRHPRRQRRLLRRSLEEQVSEIEALSVRLSRLSDRPPGTPTSGWDVTRQPPEVLSEIGRQLDLLDAAQDELTAIERAAGLVDGDGDGDGQQRDDRPPSDPGSDASGVTPAEDPLPPPETR